MPLLFVCPHCQLESLVPDELAGHSGPCAGCGKIISLPAWSSDHPHPAGPPPRRTAAWRVVTGLVIGGILGAGAVFTLLVWLIFPAAHNVSDSLRSLSCRGNLERLVRALRQYEIEHGSLPPAVIADAAGKPLHSWRVLILPQLGEQGLHERYRFDEPWNGPNNSQLIPLMPEVFACPADADARLKGETSYMAVVGPKTAFPGTDSRSRVDFKDDLSQTILLAETPVAGVAWTEPKDLNATRMKFAINGAPSGEVGSYHSAGANVVTADGIPRFLSELFPDEYLEGMTTIAGGEFIPPEALD